MGAEINSNVRSVCPKNNDHDGAIKFWCELCGTAAAARTATVHVLSCEAGLAPGQAGSQALFGWDSNDEAVGVLVHVNVTVTAMMLMIIIMMMMMMMWITEPDSS